MNNQTLIDNLRCIPDFPQKGINFRDVTTLFQSAECMKIMVDELYEIYKDKGITKIVGIELKVGGAFHSPLMQPAKEELAAAIETTEFQTPKCPVYQNVDAMPHTDPADIKQNLIAQLTSSVRWTQTVEHMIADGADDFTECGPGNVLQGLIGRIDKNVSAHGII